MAIYNKKNADVKEKIFRKADGSLRNLDCILPNSKATKTVGHDAEGKGDRLLV